MQSEKNVILARLSEIDDQALNSRAFNERQIIRSLTEGLRLAVRALTDEKALHEITFEIEAESNYYLGFKAQ